MEEYKHSLDEPISCDKDDPTPKQNSLGLIVTSIQTSPDQVQFIEENYLLLFSLVKNAFFDESQPEELLLDAVKYLFKSSTQNNCILEDWIQPILDNVLDQINDENSSRMLIILNFALDQSLIFDEEKLLDNFMSNLSYIFDENSDITALQVFVKLLMNNPNSIDPELMSFLYDQYQLGSFRTKIIIHPLICTIYLFDSTLFTTEMTATLLDSIYEFSDKFFHHLSVAKYILQENDDESLKEATVSFISALDTADLDEIDLYYVNDFLTFCSFLQTE